MSDKGLMLRSDILCPEVFKMLRGTQKTLLVPASECPEGNFTDYDAGIVPTDVLELTAFELTDPDAARFLDYFRSEPICFLILLAVTGTWGKAADDDTKEKETIRVPVFTAAMKAMHHHSMQGGGVPATPKEFWNRVSNLSETDAEADDCMVVMRLTNVFYTKFSNHNLENYVERTMQVAWRTGIPITDEIEAVEKAINYVFAIAGETRLFYLAVFDKGALKKSVLRHIVDVFLVMYIKMRCAKVQGSTPDDIRVVMAKCETDLVVTARVYAAAFHSKTGISLSMAYCRVVKHGKQWDDCDGIRWMIAELARMILSEWVKKQRKS